MNATRRSIQRRRSGLREGAELLANGEGLDPQDRESDRAHRFVRVPFLTVAAYIARAHSANEASAKKNACRASRAAISYSGMGPDFRVLIGKARKKAAAYYHLYHESIPVLQLVRSVAAVMQEFTQVRLSWVLVCVILVKNFVGFRV